MMSISILTALLQAPAAAVTTPSPTQAPLQAPPSPRPYHHVERPTHEPRRAEVRKPEFGSDDKLSQAWQRGEISVDEYVRYAVERIAHPEKVPKKFLPKEGLSHEAGLPLAFALSLARRQAKPETKAWLKEMLRQPSPEARSQASSSARAAGSWQECGGDYSFFGHYFTCVHTVFTTTRFDIYYNVDGTTEEDGVQAVDGNGNGIPDAVDTMADGFGDAWVQYESWGYSHTGHSVSVYLGFDFWGQNPHQPGFTIPTGGELDQGPIILLPDDPGDPHPAAPGVRRDWEYTYLPYHELFHGMQYHYLPIDDLPLKLTSINWWMEATAEWATHELYKRYAPNGPGYDAYASQLDLLLSRPEHAVNTSVDPWWQEPKPQYGAFILADYLTEATSFAFVRHTWEEMHDKLPLEAIGQVLEGYDLTLEDALQGFSVANYRLGTATTDLTRFLGTADGYADPHAPMIWRNLLHQTGLRPGRAVERALAWGDSAQGQVNALQPGGSSYLEFTPDGAGAGRITVTASANTAPSPLVRYLLVVWSDLTTRTPLRWVRGEVNKGTASLAINAGEVATLIMSRVDVYAASGEASGGVFDTAVQWSASLVPEPKVRVATSLNSVFQSYATNATCADWSGGDAAQSVPLPDGKRAWFFSDTFLGDPAKRSSPDQTSYLRNSILIQNGSSLRTITGGTTCKETDTGTDFWDRYAKTPVGEGGQYWTGDAKIVGDQVTKFYYQGVGDETTRGSYATFSVDDLETRNTLDVTPKNLPECRPGTSYPVIWGASLLDHAGYTYIYGWGADGSSADKPLYLARTPADADVADQSRWRYFAGASGADAQWVDACASAKPLTAKAEIDFSVVAVNGAFWLIRHTPASEAPGKIVASPSRTLWGFGSQQVDLYTPPETKTNPKYSTVYGARAHPGLLGDDNRIVISYTVSTSAANLSCWTRGYFFPDNYYPRFIDVAKTMFFAPQIP